MKRRFFNSYKLTILDRFLLVLALVGLLGVCNLKIADALLKEPFLVYGEKQVTNYATLIANKSVLEYLKDANVDSIMTTTSDDNGQISSIDFDAVMLSSLSAKVIQKTIYYLKELEANNLRKLDNCDVIYEIPMGVLTNNAILNTTGPTIPIRYALAGDVVGNMKSEVSEYGINNAIIKVFIEITISIDIIIPLAIKGKSVATVIPVAIKVINGKIPNVYFGSKDII